MKKNKPFEKSYISDQLYRKLQHNRMKKLNSILEQDFETCISEISRISEKYSISRMEVFQLMEERLLFKLR